MIFTIRGFQSNLVYRPQSWFDYERDFLLLSFTLASRIGGSWSRDCSFDYGPFRMAAKQVLLDHYHFSSNDSSFRLFSHITDHVLWPSLERLFIVDAYITMMPTWTHRSDLVLELFGDEWEEKDKCVLDTRDGLKLERVLEICANTDGDFHLHEITTAIRRLRLANFVRGAQIHWLLWRYMMGMSRNMHRLRGFVDLLREYPLLIVADDDAFHWSEFSRQGYIQTELETLPEIIPCFVISKY